MKITKNNIKKGLKVLKNNGLTELIRQIKGNNNGFVPTPTLLLNDVKFKIGTIDIVLDAKINPIEFIEQNNNLSKKYSIFTLNDKCIQNNKVVNYVNPYTFKNIFGLRAFIYIYVAEKCEFDMSFNVKYDSNIEEEISKIINDCSGTGLKLLSNYNSTDNISVKTSTFFNFLGTNYYSGGAERYLLDLHETCEEIGMNLNIYQHGDIPFFRKYNNINVIGLNIKDEKINSSYQFIDKQTKNYIYHTYNNTSLHIYSAFQECYPNHIGPSIGISHGISWDSKINHYSYGKDFFWENKKIYLDGACYCNKLVSVDTNTANWFQTIDYELGNKKFHVIPNYVDNEEFSPRKNFLEKNDKIIITYPRRLYEPRGLYIVLDIVDKILKKYNNVEFHFVGKGFEEDLKNIREKMKKYPQNIKCYSKTPQEMKDVYKYTDISLIPTQFSEGTSLSCLEALSSGNLVISTRIGGLTDLVINGYNGYLIEPSAESLYETLIKILDNFDKQDNIRKNAIETAKVFNKNNWKEKWKKEILSFDIKKKSKNNDLIEIYLNDINSISQEIMEIIKTELTKGNLIYLRLKEMPEIDNITNSLLQIVPFDEEIVSEAKKVYVQKGLKIKRKERMIYINE